ncbi:MAG TPA: trypsin-like peptidase domain-containing protein [Candidatus Limnocylindrales bacterium]|nr:trypsin-like peptidase domain-containing protein [Candidatus Limnocylindrales bacterium]
MAEKIWTALSNELASASAEAGKSVVAVLGRRHPASGVAFSRDAIVTANHVLRRDDEIIVIAGPGKKVAARIAGRDATTDLAVLRVQQPLDVPVAQWADTASLRVGDLTLALARTWRGNVVASCGIISGLIRGPWRTWRGGELDQFIRPDLNFYPGFSGGPLVGDTGRLLGINTAGLHRSGITIPAATVARVAGELLEKGRIERPYLGLGMQSVPLPESLRAKLNLISGEGLLVAQVEPGGPAEAAGVLLGDVLIELAGKPVSDTETVQQVLTACKTGQEIDATLIRGGALAKAKIKLAARPGN